MLASQAYPPYPSASPALLSSTLSYQDDFWSCGGKDGQSKYLAAVSLWSAEESQTLQEAQREVLRVAVTGPLEARVQWRLRWIPPSLAWLVELGRAWPGVEVRYYDVLDRYDQVTQFSWRKLFKLFATAAWKGQLPLPIACMRGTTTLTFRPIAAAADPGEAAGAAAGNSSSSSSPVTAAATVAAAVGAGGEGGASQRGASSAAAASSSPQATTDVHSQQQQQQGAAQLPWQPPQPPLELVAMEDRLECVPWFEAGRVANRRVARDAAQYLDTRRPPGVARGEWTDLVQRRLNLRSVPGMGFYDIDGMDDKGRGDMYDDATAALALATAAVLTLGGAIAAVYLRGLQHEALLRQALEGLYD